MSKKSAEQGIQHVICVKMGRAVYAYRYLPVWAFQGALVVKNPPASAGALRDKDMIPGSRKSPGGGHGNTLQYSCLENPMDRGTWWATVHSVATVTQD